MLEITTLILLNLISHYRYLNDKHHLRHQVMSFLISYKGNPLLIISLIPYQLDADL